MPKEYDSIKREYKSKHPKASDEEASSYAAKVFYTIFGITVKEAMDLEKQGKWEEYKKKHSKKDLEPEELEIKEFFVPTNIEFKSIDNDIYVSGFVSHPNPDEVGDLVEQETLLNKMLDPTNPYASILSYGHGWIKGNSTDSHAAGILQKAELKEHPLGGKAVYGTWKLMRTYPDYEKIVYDLNEKALKGFSIEFKDAKRKLLKYGNVVVKKIEDYIFRGVALVSRPCNPLASITGIVAKEYYIAEGVENMEAKEDKADNPEPVKEDAQAPTNDSEVVKNQTEVSNPNSDDLDNLKSELEAQKKELEKLKIEKEKERIKQELENLKANSNVLTEVGEHKLSEVEPKAPEPKPEDEQRLELQKEVSTILDDSKLSRHDKILKILDKTVFTQ
ncbi:MAG: hypothetical protein PWP52_1641 [Bacteroidales bacterium]|nr:hypothetical protein [Bacteroidales bacterium]MDN5355781.1 hypothetical protein [Rikenellaceae bacterium]